MNKPKKLYRLEHNKIILGVCAGLGEYFEIDPVFIRLIWILITIFSFGLGVVGYIAAAVVMPVKNDP